MGNSSCIPQGSSRIQVSQKKITTLSYSQLSALEELFAKDPRPSTSAKRAIAAQLHINYRCVRVWFSMRQIHNKLRVPVDTTSNTSKLYLLQLL